MITFSLNTSKHPEAHNGAKIDISRNILEVSNTGELSRLWEVAQAGRNQLSFLVADLNCAELEEALEAGESVLDTLEETAVGLVASDPDTRAAGTLREIFEAAERLPDLCRWTAERLQTMVAAKVPEELAAIPADRRHIRLAHTVFDLAGQLREVWSDIQKEQIISSLGKVWEDHVAWRRYAAKVATSTNLENWLDPATAAADSLLILDGTPPKAIVRHLEEVDRLGAEYPEALRNYCYYILLRHLACGCQPASTALRTEETSWSRYTSHAFARVVADWSARHPFLLEWACLEMQFCSGEEWKTLAPQLFAHARDRLGATAKQKLLSILGEEAYEPALPVTVLAFGAFSRPSISPTPLRGFSLTPPRGFGLAA